MSVCDCPSAIHHIPSCALGGVPKRRKAPLTKRGIKRIAENVLAAVLNSGDGSSVGIVAPGGAVDWLWSLERITSALEDAARRGLSTDARPLAQRPKRRPGKR